MWDVRRESCWALSGIWWIANGPLKKSGRDIELDLDEGRGVFHLRIAPIRRHGRRVARLFILQDITASRHAQDDRLDSEKLKAALEMAGAVCHKLNQPIQGISGYAELLMLKVAPDDPLYKKIAGIKSQTEKMGEITNKLMGITRYRTARYTSGETIVDIDQSSPSRDRMSGRQMAGRVGRALMITFSG